MRPSEIEALAKRLTMPQARGLLKLTLPSPGRLPRVDVAYRLADLELLVCPDWVMYGFARGTPCLTPLGKQVAEVLKRMGKT